MPDREPYLSPEEMVRRWRVSQPDTTPPGNLKVLRGPVGLSGAALFGVLLTVALYRWLPLPSANLVAAGFASRSAGLAAWLLANAALAATFAAIFFFCTRPLPGPARTMALFTVCIVPALVIAAAFTFKLYRQDSDHNFVARQNAVLHEAQARANEARIARESAANAQRERAMSEVLTLRGRVVAKWRADIETAKSSADPGVVPPMLRVAEHGTFFEVTNQGADAVCLSMERVARHADAIERCRIGGETCQALLPGATARLQLFRSGNPEGCLEAPLEFRLGDAFTPELSWWSGPAVGDYTDGDAAERYRRFSTAELAREKRLLDGLLADDARAARWIEQLAGLAPRASR
jgi:hypothetical protein